MNQDQSILLKREMEKQFYLFFGRWKMVSFSAPEVSLVP